MRWRVSCLRAAKGRRERQLRLIQEPERVPGWLEFILMEEPAQVPPLLQLLILELAIDGLKLAALNTPNILTTSFSMIGAIILGDFAVQSGWFSAEVMLYMAVVAIANYNQPNLEPRHCTPC